MADLSPRRGWQPPKIGGFTVEVSRACKNYGGVRALKGVDIRVRKGSLYGLIGPNGAGKSTLMKSLFGSVRLNEGSIRVMGLNPAVEDLRIKAFTGIVPEAEMPPSFLTGSEFMDFSMEVRGLKPSNKEKNRWFSFFDIEGQSDIISKDLSKGTRQKLMLASAFIHKPPLLLLDEPFINLDPIYQRKVKDYLREYVDGGGTILISTHILPLAEEICDTVSVLHKGEILRTDKTEEILSESADLESAFLEMVGYTG
ncbi:MAG: ABC transporter ATP-binding protein [Thermoplasmatota archaeon]